MALPLGAELGTLPGSNSPSAPRRWGLLAPAPVPCPLTPPLPRRPPCGSPTLNVILSPPPVTLRGSQRAGRSRTASPGAARLLVCPADSARAPLSPRDVGTERVSTWLGVTEPVRLSSQSLCCYLPCHEAAKTLF